MQPTWSHGLVWAEISQAWPNLYSQLAVLLLLEPIVSAKRPGRSSGSLRNRRHWVLLPHLSLLSLNAPFSNRPTHSLLSLLLMYYYFYYCRCTNSLCNLERVIEVSTPFEFWCFWHHLHTQGRHLHSAFAVCPSFCFLWTAFLHLSSVKDSQLIPWCVSLLSDIIVCMLFWPSSYCIL